MKAGSTETLSHDTGAGMKPSDLANYATKVEKVTSNADTTDTADTTTTENEELGVTGTNTNIGETSETESYENNGRRCSDDTNESSARRSGIQESNGTN